MRVTERELAEFMDGDRDADWLTEKASQLEVAPLSADLEMPLILTRDDLIRLCDAHLDGPLPLETLSHLAAAILASDNLAWDETTQDGELVAEVLWEWSTPETETGLTTESVSIHRQTLESPPKPKLTSQN